MAAKKKAKSSVKKSTAKKSTAKGSTAKKSTAKKSTAKKSSAKKAKSSSSMAGTKARPPLKPNADGVVLLSGGNPQIAKGDGDAPVQAYIAAMPGWKHELGKRVDAIIVKNVPNVRKAVRWNSPFYGVDDQGFFVSYHCFNKYLKVTFFKGAMLQPEPPGGSKHPEVRYYDIYEGKLDEALLTKWVKQAAALPGWDPSGPG